MIDLACECKGRRSVALILICVGILCHAHRGVAAPARFWISLSGSNSTGPEVPTLNLEHGGKRTIYVWGRPATDSTDYKNLLNLSLNLVPSASSNAVYDIMNSFHVFNPGNRFEIVRDAFKPTGSQIASTGSPERVSGLAAAVAQTDLYTGIGLNADDSSCSVGCEPSWLIASFELLGIASSGSARLHLQIGSPGINHAGEFSEMTEVVFGNDSESVSYNGKFNREQTFPNAASSLIDSPDLIINAMPLLAGDFNGDATVNAADYVVWRSKLGDAINLPGDTTPGSVSTSDYGVWRGNFGALRTPTSAAAVSTPEPHAAHLILISALVSLRRWRSARRNMTAYVARVDEEVYC